MHRTALSWALGAALALTAGIVQAEDGSCEGRTERHRSDHPHGRVQLGHWGSFLPGPRLGLELQRLTPQLREFLEVPGEDGVLVAAVEPSSPAAAAGLEAGDVILEAGGAPVREPRDLVHTVVKWPNEERLPLVVSRDGKRRTFEVEPRPRPELPDLDTRSWVMPWGADALHELRNQLRELERRLEELERELEEGDERT